MNSETRNCQACKTPFTIEPDDFDFYEKIKVPPPTWCPECRAKRRLVFWNQNNLYRKKDAQSGKEVFCTYPEEADIVIYDHDYWLSDAWDPLSFGEEVDFSKPFLAQVRELQRTVPWPSRSIQQLVNSDYCNQAGRLKNCYLCFNGNSSEDSAYGVGFNGVRDCLDFFQSSDCESSYEMFCTGNCYQCFYSTDCDHCRNVWFSSACQNCQDSIGCVGLKNAQYCILNKQYTKEEYGQKVKELNLGSYASNRAFAKRVHDLYLKIPVRYMHGQKNVDVLGDYVYSSKNVKYSFEIVHGENVKYSQNLAGGKDSYDYANWGLTSELVYDSVSVGENCRNIRFCFDCSPNCTDLEYCLNCSSSSNLFGCVGLRSKQYCILNKQYSKEEYLALREKVIEHMKAMPYKDEQGRTYPYGEFFPISFSPLAYTEATVCDYYPLSKGDAIAQGFVWREPNPREFKTTIDSADLPDHISNATDAVIKEAIACESCKRAYRIIPMEFAFYQRFGVPLPRRCHACRYRDRIANRNPPKWYERHCNCASAKSENGVYENKATHFHGEAVCPNTFQTSYAPDRPEIVYCEPCYQAEVA